jgi:hypothetical protein
MKEYQFEINVDESYKDAECIDEWGAAFLWLDDDRGVEYNFCIDSGTNCSAIYKMEYDGEYMQTDYAAFIHYEIDFDDPMWTHQLAIAMAKAAKELFDEV